MWIEDFFGFFWGGRRYVRIMMDLMAGFLNAEDLPLGGLCLLVERRMKRGGGSYYTQSSCRGGRNLRDVVLYGWFSFSNGCNISILCEEGRISMGDR